MKLLVLNGPNLNLLGTREPEIYGHDTLDDVAARCIALGHARNLDVEFVQSNYEGELVDQIQQAIGTVDAILINAAAYTHTSIALHDALKCFDGIKIELHISNPHMRESFRHVSYVSLAVDAIVMGLGVDGYEHAVRLIADRLNA